MTKITSSFSAIAIILGLLLHAGAAQATTAVRTWVSGAGSGVACTRAAPCATFAAAYAATSPGGEIDVLDGGEFGVLNIGHALTIANDGAGTAAVTPPSNSTFAIFILAAPTDAIVLRGLTLNGIDAQSPGVSFYTGASLLIDHCNIQGFSTDPGILFGPTSAAELWVKDTVLSYDGFSGGASASIVSGNGGSATAHFERVQILHGIGNGIRADGTGGVGAVDVELHEVTVERANGGSGIVAVSQASGGAAVSIMADNVTSSHNVGYGLRAVGGTASVTLRRSTIEANGVGLGAASGGQIFSYGDNSLANNSNGKGVTPTAIPLE